MENIKFIAIAAVSVDGIIGIGDNIPWKISEDFKHFRQTTMGNTLIVGKNTYSTLPEKAFEGRNYFVLNGGNEIIINKPNVHQFECIDEMNEYIRVFPDIIANNKIYVIGGAGVYESLIDYCDEVIITWVNKYYPNGDKFFPIDNLFTNFEVEVDEEWRKSDSGLSYKFTKYNRI